MVLRARSWGVSAPHLSIKHSCVQAIRSRLKRRVCSRCHFCWSNERWYQGGFQKGSPHTVAVEFLFSPLLFICLFVSLFVCLIVFFIVMLCFFCFFFVLSASFSYICFLRKKNTLFKFRLLASLHPLSFVFCPDAILGFFIPRSWGNNDDYSDKNTRFSLNSINMLW